MRLVPRRSLQDMAGDLWCSMVYIVRSTFDLLLVSTYEGTTVCALNFEVELAGKESLREVVTGRSPASHSL